MAGHIRVSSEVKKAALSMVLGLLVAIAFLVIGEAYPLPVMIGVLPIPTAAALALGTALAATAVLTPHPLRKPALSMPRAGLLQLLAWWLGAALALALVASAAWRVWGVIFLFAAIVATVKAVSVFSYVKQEYEFRLWLPFAAIIGIGAFVVALGLIIARPNIPPPVDAARHTYRHAAGAGNPTTRVAPDLSRAGFTLDVGGDVDLGGLPTTFFSFHGADGIRVDLYESDYGFPRPPGSSGMTDPPGWWAKVGDLHLRGGSADAEFMIVGPTKRVVLAVARAL